ncbi:MAG: hypothetical protein WCT08_02235 [Patescibacteria group bacterium]
MLALKITSNVNPASSNGGDKKRPIPNKYVPKEKPDYHPANGANIAIMTVHGKQYTGVVSNTTRPFPSKDEKRLYAFDFTCQLTNNKEANVTVFRCNWLVGTEVYEPRWILSRKDRSLASVRTLERND